MSVIGQGRFGFVFANNRTFFEEIQRQSNDLWRKTGIGLV
jgi:hypothetical protein